MRSRTSAALSGQIEREHPRSAVVVERGRHELGTVASARTQQRRWLRAERSPKRRGCPSNRLLLVPPCWSAAAVGRLLEVQDQIVGGAEALASRVLAHEVAAVLVGRPGVIRPGEVDEPRRIAITAGGLVEVRPLRVDSGRWLSRAGRAVDAHVAACQPGGDGAAGGLGTASRTASRFGFCQPLSDPRRPIRIFGLPNECGVS